MKKNTRLTTIGRDPENNHGIVNPPVYHASTILFSSLDDLEQRDSHSYRNLSYGIQGTPTTFALEDAFTELEGAYRSIAVSSGLMACTVSLMSFVESGDHILMADSVYGPTRRFCNNVLSKMGVETTYYDPMIGAGIDKLIRENTRVVYCESPGSHTFEIQDIDAISAAAHQHGAIVIVDNTWAAGYYYRPLEHGADVSIQAATKYIGGHSDVMMGLIAMTEKTYDAINDMTVNLGTHAAPDDCYLTLRGLRSMPARLAQHYKSGLEVASWLKQRPEVDKVLHPALPDCPGHELWKRDFTGACGLFAIALHDFSRNALAAMLDDLELFNMGASWGGFESLILPGVKKFNRKQSPWPYHGPLLRLHVGLEDPEDLINDLAAGFERLNDAS